MFAASLDTPVAPLLTNPAGRKGERSTHEAAVPLHKLARVTPPTTAEPACWVPLVALATELVAPAGARLTHDAAVPVHRLATPGAVGATWTKPTCCEPLFA